MGFLYINKVFFATLNFSEVIFRAFNDFFFLSFSTIKVTHTHMNIYYILFQTSDFLLI